MVTWVNNGFVFMRCEMRVFSISGCVSCHLGYVQYVMPLHCRYSKKLLLVNFVTGSQGKGTRESTLLLYLNIAQHEYYKTGPQFNCIHIHQEIKFPLNTGWVINSFPAMTQLVQSPYNRCLAITDTLKLLRRIYSFRLPRLLSTTAPFVAGSSFAAKHIYFHAELVNWT